MGKVGVMETKEITWDDVRPGHTVRDAQGRWFTVSARKNVRGRLNIKFDGYGSWAPVERTWPVTVRVDA